MKRVHTYSEKARLYYYIADVFVVRCSDNRFWKIFKHFMRRLKFKGIDPESVAGGAILRPD